MKKKFTSYIFFIAGIINIIFSMVNFSGNKISIGVTYLFFAIVFIVLGVRYRNKYK